MNRRPGVSRQKTRHQKNQYFRGIDAVSGTTAPPPSVHHDTEKLLTAADWFLHGGATHVAHDVTLDVGQVPVWVGTTEDGPSKIAGTFSFGRGAPMLVYVRPSNEATDDPSKLARYLFRDGG